MRNFMAFAVWTALCVMPSAHAAQISGQITLPKKGLARAAVVYLKGESVSQPLLRAIVDQRDKTFVPHVSVVTLGTTVEFPNHDTVFHNVFASLGTKKFDLGVYPRGMTKRVKFDRPGVVCLLCNVHAEMSAYILVVDTPYYAITDTQGRFQIRNVPPGTYTLHAWHESGAVLTQTVGVKSDDAPLALTLARRPR